MPHSEWTDGDLASAHADSLNAKTADRISKLETRVQLLERVVMKLLAEVPAGVDRTDMKMLLTHTLEFGERAFY